MSDAHESGGQDIAGAHPIGLIDWRMIEGKGRGVIVLRDCPAGTEVERSPIVLVPDEDLVEHEQTLTVFDQYLLYWSDEPGKTVAMGGGMLMIYNHSDKPNIEFQTGPEPETMSVFALRDIVAGEELTYDYDVPLWFVQASSSRGGTPGG